MNKYIVFLFTLVLLLNCELHRRNNFQLEFDQSTIYIDEELKQGNILLENIRIIDSINKKETDESIDYLSSLSEEKLLSSDFFKIKTFNATSEKVYVDNKTINIEFNFDYNFDPSLIIKEVLSKILQIECKTYYSEEYESVLVTYFSSDREIKINSKGSEHINIHADSNYSTNNKYITTWDKTKGPLKLHFSDLIINNSYRRLLDDISSASYTE